MKNNFLIKTPDGLGLQLPNSDMQPLVIDFNSGSMNWRKNTSGKNQPLAKAIGIKQEQLAVLDTTAGLGRDSFILASLGCQVTLLERSSILYELLEDGLKRAAMNENLFETINRMTLIHADAIDWLTHTEKTFDVIYCDPMFPDTKKSALVKKEMQLLQKLLGSDNDADALFQVAYSKAKRIVVKRHRHAPYLADKKPNFITGGKTTRFDVYLA